MAIVAALTNRGRALLAGLIAECGLGGSRTLVPPSYLGIGNGNGTDAAAADDVLFSAIALARVAGTPSVIQSSGSPPYDTWKIQGTLTLASNASVGEVGAFPASSGGYCSIHGTFPAVAGQTGDQFVFVITLSW